MSAIRNQIPDGIVITEPLPQVTERVLTRDALIFLADLERKFRTERKMILARRQDIQQRINDGEMPAFLDSTKAIRASEWKISTTPEDIQDRRVEITGPTDRKMVINALNSGASVFMADFEDANSPTWNNMLEGQSNLIDAVRKTIEYQAPDGKIYKLIDHPAILMIRPRGWHLDEKHFLIDGEPISGSLFDFGLYLFHNAHELVARKTGPYFYLAKLENHLEARLWNDVFAFAQKRMNLPTGTIKATVLIETILAAFEMDEILFELREHSAGLNAGRWDYIFSTIKKFNQLPDFVLPDRSQITMITSFMRSYTELLVHTCHRRGAHAMGGMAAYIPSRRDEEINRRALEKVIDDKLRESSDGFDGTWVAHPDLVPVAKSVFDHKLGSLPHQKHRLRDDVVVKPKDLLNFYIPEGAITEEGVRNNINVAIQYLASWLAGRGAVAINNLMEDTATAEIARSQLWQWVHRENARLTDGRRISHALFENFFTSELDQCKELYSGSSETYQFDLAGSLLRQLVISDNFIDFLTITGYGHLP